ncbi:hypothetical protein CDL12_11202 [Handroanthus impetiginosus]|uniref:Uncharacterized protein n=1 Tax=Handroanthus impetiginosus TaxID=429701 RepID=A0A2G9HF63_9LAMI|nr:hypothetical protein CDL12_11202 [Handroanthus impetiginosus]
MFMVGAILRFGSIAAWIFHTIARMGFDFLLLFVTKLTGRLEVCNK